MSSNEKEYKELFLAEAQDNHGELNRLMTAFEKDTKDKNVVHAIFRITHTLKGNALGMGFSDIASLAHTLEDFFGLIRNQKLDTSAEHIPVLFKAFDVLGELIDSLKSGRDVKYKGIKAKLDVIIRKAEQRESIVEEPTSEESTIEAIMDMAGLQSPTEHEAEATSDDSSEGVSKIAFSDSVQVPVKKLDNLLNLVGELIIEKDRMMASQHGGRSEYSRLHRIASDLQYSVMDVRLVQVGFLFNKFHRVVRDAAVAEGKKVRLKLEGTETEIDRNVLQVISDSLIHLIRNAVGHGVELPDVRSAQGKDIEGTITLSAFTEADVVVIQIEDDGKGIDVSRVKDKAVSKGLITKEYADQLTTEDAIMLIFEPGFSTMDQVTSIAGRGVGMDVVKRALDSIGGTIRVDTKEGKGSTFILSLPSSMAVKSTLLFELGSEKYAIPLSYTESVVSLYVKDIYRVGEGLVATHLGRTISVVFLRDLFRLFSQEYIDVDKPLQEGLTNLHPEQRLDIVVVSHNNRMVGLVVDKLLQQKEIVEKPLARPVDSVNVISGVTILGNGSVCLVLNVANIMNTIFSISLKNKFAKV